MQASKRMQKHNSSDIKGVHSICVQILRQCLTYSYHLASFTFVVFKNRNVLFFVCFFSYVQYNRAHWALHQTLLQRFLHRHPKEALTHHQVFIRPLSGHKWETWQDGPWHLEWDDWRGMKWHIFSLSFSHINTLTLQTCQQFRAHGKWAKLTSENIK